MDLLPVSRDGRTLIERRRDLIQNLETRTSSSYSKTTSSTTIGGKTQSHSESSEQHMKATKEMGRDGKINEHREESSMHSTSGDATGANRLTATDLSRGHLTNYHNQFHDSFEDSIWDEEVSKWLSRSKNCIERDVENVKKTALFRLDDDDIISKRHMLSSAATKDIMDTHISKQLTDSNTYALRTTQDCYGMGNDGTMHFKVHVDVSEYNADDIKVQSSSGVLTISAKSEKKTASGSSWKEFSKTFSLPAHVDHQRFTCTITKDNILVIEAPVKRTEKHSALSIADGLSIRPLRRELVSASRALKLTGSSGPTVVQDEITKRKKVHLEIAIDKDYEPDDFNIKVEGNKIYVKGKHEIKTATKSSSKEFSRYYEVPEELDPLLMAAELFDGHLIIEAPLYHAR